MFISVITIFEIMTLLSEARTRTKDCFAARTTFRQMSLSLSPGSCSGLGPGLPFNKYFVVPVAAVGIAELYSVQFDKLIHLKAFQRLVGRSVLNFKKPFNEAQLCWNTSVKIIIESLWAIRRWCSPISKVCARVFVWREIFATATAKTQFLTGL